MVPDVYRMLKEGHEVQGKPVEGQVYPTAVKGGHLEQGSGKTQHSAAIAKVSAETIKTNAKRELAGEKPLPLPLPAFEPYVMRHTALTLISVLRCVHTAMRSHSPGSRGTTQKRSRNGTVTHRPTRLKPHSRNSGIARKWSPTVVGVKMPCHPPAMNRHG